MGYLGDILEEMQRDGYVVLFYEADDIEHYITIEAEGDKLWVSVDIVQIGSFIPPTYYQPGEYDMRSIGFAAFSAANLVEVEQILYKDHAVTLEDSEIEYAFHWKREI